MSNQELLPEHRVRSEYFALLTLMWLDEEEVLERMKLHRASITDPENRIISLLPSR
jgi:hypothetical protein